MKEYEISNNDKVLGKVNIFNDNIKENLNNSLIESKTGLSFETINISDIQTYELEYKVDNVDELFDILSNYIYDNDKIFEKIEEILNYNNINFIKKDTIIKIIVPEIYLSKLNKSKTNIDINSLLKSKIHFIKSTITTLNNIEMIENLNSIINDYNSYISSSEYEFYSYEEQKEVIKKYLNKADELIKYIENNTNYKYGRNYIIPIKISNN